MADVKISQLPAATTPLAGTEEVPLVQSGVTKKATVDDIIAGAGTVTSVTGTAPVVSSGGTTPAISMAAANTTTDGYLTSTDWNTFNNKIGTLTSTDGSVTVSGTGASRDLSVAYATDVVVLVRNSTGSTLAKGTVVYISGATGQTPTVSKALATSDATSAQTLGMIRADIANNATGYVVVTGLITNIDTSAYTDGAQLYLSGVTAGAVTSTKPYAPIHLVYVGVVEYAHGSNGKIFVKVQNGYELDELHNVSAQTPSNGQTLVYNSSTQLWEATQLGLTNGVTGVLPVVNGGNGTATPALTAGTNVTITGTWPNYTIAASGGSGGGDVSGPASSTDNAIARFDGTTGKLIQNSGVQINDLGEVNVGVWKGTEIGIAYGGTAASTAVQARGNLLPSYATNAGKVLAVNTGATDVEWISAGGVGTVTSVALTMPSGFSVSGSPVTSSGTLAVTTTLSGMLKGTGTGIAAATAGTDYPGLADANTFTANQVISDNSANAALRITQVGTGNALLVEDAANPDATPFVIDTNGQVIVGSTSSQNSFSGLTPKLQVQGVNNNNSTVAISDWQTGGFGGPFLNLDKSRGGAVGTRGILSAGDRLGVLTYSGDDGTNFIPAARIEANVDGTPGTNDMPGRLTFSTTADGAASLTERMRIDNAGQVGIGGTPSAGRTLEVLKNITGATTSSAVRAAGVIQSDVTSQTRYFAATSSTAAASFTLSSLPLFYAAQGTFGAGSTVTSQYGYLADSTLTGATNNYGFYSNIASGTGRWNFYANGTAANYFAGDILVGTTTSRGGLLQLAGNTGAAATTQRINAFAFDARLRLDRANANETIVASGDSIAQIAFDGYDGATYSEAARIQAFVDGTPGTNDMPGRLVFSTTADGAASPTERFRISNFGGWGLAGANYGTSGTQAIVSNGSAASPTWQDVVTPTGTQTLTNKTLTTPVISSISNTGTLTLPTSTDTLVGRATTDTLTNKTLTSPVITNATLTTARETTTVSATAATGTINYDALTQSVLYYTTNASGNWTINLRGSSGTTLNSMMAVGESLTVTFLATQGSTAYYQSAFQVDGAPVTPKWQGGAAPTNGNASGIDAYSITVIKTASATFTALLSQTQFA